MKVEGMQYPLAVKPVGTRNGNQHKDKELSEDAVYFEPDERREERNKQAPQKEEQQQLPLELQVIKEVEPAKEQDAPSEKKSGERSPLNIIV